MTALPQNLTLGKTQDEGIANSNRRVPINYYDHNPNKTRLIYLTIVIFLQLFPHEHLPNRQLTIQHFLLN